MKKREEFARAVSVVAAALGLDVASGRAMAAFYAQTAGASWIGVAFAGLFFGTMTGLLYALMRRSGALSLPALLQRLCGGGSGRVILALYGLILLSCASMAAGEAAHIGALVLPVHHAGIYAALAAVMLSAAAALSGRRVLQALGAVFLGSLAMCMIALLFFARLPMEEVRFGIELKLENNVPAALLLALLHSAVGLCISSGAAVDRGNMHPGRFGMYAGVLYAAVLGLGNAVLQMKQPVLMRLQMPYVALSSAWGSAGFYLSAALIYLGSITALTGMIYGCIPKRKSRILIEN